MRYRVSSPMPWRDSTSAPVSVTMLVRPSVIAVPDALKHHLSGRLLDWGYIGKSPTGVFHITDTGRKLIRRQDN